MKNNFKTWRLVPVLAVGLYLFYNVLNEANSDGFFVSIDFLIIELVFSGVVFYNFLYDRREYRQTKNKLSFLPSLVALALIALCSITQLILDSRDDTPVIIQASNDGGFNGCGFDFRENGTYRFFNYGGLGITYFRGNYEIKDSIITLDKANIDNVIKSKTLAIRPFNGADTSLHQIIYQINTQHQIIDKDMGFIINQDDRKK